MRGLSLLVVAVLAGGVVASVSASHRRATTALAVQPGKHLLAANKLIREAMRKEENAKKYVVDWYVSEGRLKLSSIADKALGPAGADLERAAAEIRSAHAADEISASDTGAAEAHLARAIREDNLAEIELRAEQKQTNSYFRDHFLSFKKNFAEHLKNAAGEKALALAKVTAPAASPAGTDTLTSPAGTGTLTVTKVACYVGTGGNAERDADLSLNGVAGWHFQQVYPASFIPGGSQSAPGFFLEHGQAPYTAPGTTIYGGFGVTVSGNVATITSGQQVAAKGGLVDAKGVKVAGSIDLTFTCPR